MATPVFGLLQGAADAATNNNYGLAMLGKGLGAGLALIGQALLATQARTQVA